MKFCTLYTPDGPFTLLAQRGIVFASGWTADTEAILARLRPVERPKEVKTTEADGLDVAVPAAAVLAYYDGNLEAVNAVPVRQYGSGWRLAGWRRLREIPPGEPLSYSALARALGNPKAVRAAASICASNAPALFVPCHRVVRRDGSMGGFAWGTAVKVSLLDREAAAARPR